MTLERYLQLKEVHAQSLKQGRRYCTRCSKPEITCYCGTVVSFHSQFRLVILIHKAEARRSVATGRMAHLCVTNSLLFEGTDFTDHEGVNDLLNDARNHCVVLFPAKGAVNISELPTDQRLALFPTEKQLVVFVIDGTWAQARRMKRLSRGLAGIPAICFTPGTPSMFLVRQQPEINCYSTIEAIHIFINLISEQGTRVHDNLLSVFNYMVSQQVQYEMEYGYGRRKLT